MYDSVFRENLPERLPTECGVDYSSQTKEGSKALHRSFFKLSPADLEDARDYV